MQYLCPLGCASPQLRILWLLRIILCSQKFVLRLPNQINHQMATCVVAKFLITKSEGTEMHVGELNSQQLQ